MCIRSSARRNFGQIPVALATLIVLAYGGVAGAQSDSLPGVDTALARDEYLKAAGQNWERIQRTPDGQVRTLGAVTLTVTGMGASRTMASASLSSGGGLFQPYVALATGSWPEAVAIGDVNGDGRNDVVMVTSSYFDPSNDHTLFVWLQNPDGTLAPPVKYYLGGGSTSVAIGDVNGDGLNDVVVGIGTGIGVLTQNTDGTLDPMVLYPTVDSLKVRVADVNNDGLLDIVGLGWGTNTVTVFTQDGAGGLSAPVVYAVPHNGYDDLELGDVNNDGLTDVVVMSGQGFGPSISILYQDSSGQLGGLTSLNVASSSLTHGIDVGDVNGDGLNDIVASYGGNRPSSFIAEFTQNSNGGMDGPVSSPSLDIPEPIRIADVNGDGLLDVVVAHGGWVSLGVYLQQPDGTLAPEQLYPIPYASHYNPHGLAVGDINGDGINDVVIADYNNGLVILYGTGSSN